jgi:hypothetical protein
MDFHSEFLRRKLMSKFVRTIKKAVKILSPQPNAVDVHVDEGQSNRVNLHIDAGREAGINVIVNGVVVGYMTWNDDIKRLALRIGEGFPDDVFFFSNKIEMNKPMSVIFKEFAALPAATDGPALAFQDGKFWKSDGVNWTEV